MSLLLTMLWLAQSTAPPAAELTAIREKVRVRSSTIERLLDAMARKDERAFTAAGGEKIAFSSTPTANFVASIGPRTERLTVDSFRDFASCKASSPRVTGIDWHSVIWDCPDDGPVADAQFSFKFSGRKLIAVQKSYLPPRIFKVRTDG